MPVVKANTWKMIVPATTTVAAIPAAHAVEASLVAAVAAVPALPAAHALAEAVNS